MKKQLIKKTSNKAKKPSKKQINPIVNLLIKARIEKGMSIKDIAKAMKRYESQVYNFEKKIENPTFKVIQLYAKAVGYSVDMVLKPLKTKG